MKKCHFMNKFLFDLKLNTKKYVVYYDVFMMLFNRVRSNEVSISSFEEITTMKHINNCCLKVLLSDNNGSSDNSAEFQRFVNIVQYMCNRMVNDISECLNQISETPFRDYFKKKYEKAMENLQTNSIQ
ncbi:hypothetical protein RF11_00496 [Thelohanellus kitauei]|uniref:Uncharacterized protein n=1 Tax=Thelohanellus kitauei TaxID=669202 RepID=A0A0C2MWS0_THEKT|nr:hypothetical protein RF11_00496 [Thelohanellus kitauei]